MGQETEKCSLRRQKRRIEKRGESVSYCDDSTSKLILRKQVV